VSKNAIKAHGNDIEMINAPWKWKKSKIYVEVGKKKSCSPLVIKKSHNIDEYPQIDSIIIHLISDIFI
jgi:hypothetical protein